MEQGIIAIKEYFTLTKSPELEPHHQVQFIDTLHTPSWGGFNHLDTVNIFQVLPTGRTENVFNVFLIIIILY